MAQIESSKNSFWQSPIPLKFVVVWIFFLTLGSFWVVADSLIFTSFIKIVSFIAGVVYFYLAIGLAERDNAARTLTSVIMGIGTLIRIVLLMIIVFGKVDSGHIEYHSVKYPVLPNQVMTFLILNIIFNMGILYILLRPSTKALFAHLSSLTFP